MAISLKIGVANIIAALIVLLIAALILVCSFNILCLNSKFLAVINEGGREGSEGGRKWEGGREREREGGRETDRQTDRQRDPPNTYLLIIKINKGINTELKCSVFVSFY